MLVLAAFLINLLTHQLWIEDLGDTPYLRFLRSEWVLAAGGNGLQLDYSSLPLPPVLYIATSAIFGTSITEAWLPILLNVGIMLVLVRSVLKVYPSGAKLIAGVLLLASPFYYLLQQELNIQLFVLLLGFQLTTLRAFRLQPTVGHVTVAILANVVLSLVSYAALIAIAAAVIYLLFIASYQLLTSAEIAKRRW